MAKRKRKKRRRQPGHSPAAPAPAAEQRPAKQAVRPAAGKAGPPPAPWGSFPLSELVIVVALVLLVVGFFVGPPRGAIMLGTGLVLGSLAGVELSAREHFSGYRSHTLLLAGAVGIAVVIGLTVGAKIGPGIALIAGAVCFGVSAYLFAGAFRRRSGGSLFRVRP